jgi:hypothetical protein
VHLGEDLSQRQIHQPGVFRSGVDEHTRGSIAAQFAKTHLHRPVRQLLQDTLSSNVVVEARHTSGRQLAPEFLRDQFDNGRVRND